MPRLAFKNTFGSQNSKLDLQRVDLFKLTIVLPAALGLDWRENVEFAIEKFPFPDRQMDLHPMKYMQHTNWLLGADAQRGPVEIPVRYAFAQRTAEALEKWMWLCSNPLTGGVGLTTEVKAKGLMRWLVPNMQRQIQDIRGNAQPTENTMNEGLTFQLEGCLIKGLKFVDASMTESTPVNMTFTLSVDDWYPVDINKMQVTG